MACKTCEHETEVERSKKGDPAPARAPGRAHRAMLRRAAGINAPALQRRLAQRLGREGRDANGVAADAEQAVERAATSLGQPLPADLRGSFEGTLGADLGAVRVHTGAESAEAAWALGAHAYALGKDIHFSEGSYQPSSVAGQHLLAHEVAHTVQQSGGSVYAPQFRLAVSASQDRAEIEADRAADVMVQSYGTIQRKSTGGSEGGAAAAGGRPTTYRNCEGKVCYVCVDDGKQCSCDWFYDGQWVASTDCGAWNHAGQDQQSTGGAGGE